MKTPPILRILSTTAIAWMLASSVGAQAPVGVVRADAVRSGNAKTQ